jgi:hypothetical protein
MPAHLVRRYNPLMSPACAAAVASLSTLAVLPEGRGIAANWTFGGDAPDDLTRDHFG